MSSRELATSITGGDGSLPVPSLSAVERAEEQVRTDASNRMQHNTTSDLSARLMCRVGFRELTLLLVHYDQLKQAFADYTKTSVTLRKLNEALDDYWNADPRNREPEIKALTAAQMASFEVLSDGVGRAPRPTGSEGEAVAPGGTPS